MAQPIYKIFMARMLQPWFQLSKEEQDGLTGKLDEALAKVGGKRPFLLNTGWSSDQWPVAGLEEFPNIEAVQKYMADLDELKWFQYCESTNVLGTKIEE
jgi:hypothetical protein